MPYFFICSKGTAPALVVISVFIENGTRLRTIAVFHIAICPSRHYSSPKKGKSLVNGIPQFGPIASAILFVLYVCKVVLIILYQKVRMKYKSEAKT